MITEGPREWRRRRRNANQVERARIRDAIRSTHYDPESLEELAVEPRDMRPLSGDEGNREWMLRARRRKVRTELKSKQDLGDFIRAMSRSKTLYALIALGFFRHVLYSAEYGEDHRYKLAIREAMEDARLAKVLQRKWDELDREFPDNEHHGW